MAYDNAWLQEVFARKLPNAGYAVREPQLAMANFVQTALLKNRHLLAEAGVGTGKTFAYLIPLLGHLRRERRPVIIATHSIALQEQLMQDIPAIARVLDLPGPALLAKGKDHYMCKAALEAFEKRTPEPGPEADQLLRWGRRTMTGDRAQAPGTPDALWDQVSWGERSPCGAACKHPERCGAFLVRRRWQELEEGFIVTNHHQFFADMQLRARGAHLFPLASAIVLDEAHAAVDAARDMLGARGTPRAVAPAFRDALREVGRAAGWDAVVELAQGLPAQVAVATRWDAGEEADRFAVRVDDALAHTATALLDNGAKLVAHLGGMPTRPGRTAAIERLEASIAPLRALLDPAGQVAWVEGDPKARRADVLASSPRDLAGAFRERLFQRQVPVILTSATLAPAGDFGWFEAETGIERPLRCLADSPFDFATQARLYVAEDLPDPSRDAEAFYAAAHERLAELLAAVGGRSLALFTAKRRARAAHLALAGQAAVPVWLQGRDAPDAIARLEGAQEGSLFGTAYWTGVDVPGLRLVVIVKLPFPAPDPLVAAQEAAARARGEDPFEAVLLPAMLLKLRQGAGRLIRREADRGVIAILDPRAATRGYAQAIAEALPELPRVGTPAEAARFVALPAG